MYVAPSTTIKVLKNVPLDITHKNLIYFSSSASQKAYFEDMTKFTFSNCTYVKDTRKIRIGKRADDLYECNYLMYQNPDFGPKWFYAFITGIEYISNDLSEISFELDDAQTWLLNVDYEISPSFVEREHVTDDTIGSHLLDEGLALGDFITNSLSSKYFTDWWICVGSTVDIKMLGVNPDGSTKYESGYVYAGIYSGVSWYCFDFDTALWSFPAILQGLAANGKADAIVSMFMIPKDVVSSLQNDGGYLQAVIREPSNVPAMNIKTLDGYTPRNNKLLTYPYRSLVLSNNEGNVVTLRYEFFKDEIVDIEYQGGLQPNSKIIAYPVNYKGVDKNLQESVAVGNFPQCCWQKEVYANWLASQSVRWGYQEDRFTRNAVSSILTGGAVGGANVGLATKLQVPAGSSNSITGMMTALNVGTNAVSTVNSQLDMYSKMAEEKEVFSMIPNSVNGTIGNGYTNVSIGRYGFQLEAKSIRAEVARCIDDYLDMYGYKVNRVKVPNVNTRPHWNYIKTVGVTLKGKSTKGIPADVTARLRAIFDSGVTIWKNPSEVGNYELSNSI